MTPSHKGFPSLASPRLTKESGHRVDLSSAELLATSLTKLATAFMGPRLSCFRSFLKAIWFSEMYMLRCGFLDSALQPWPKTQLLITSPWQKKQGTYIQMQGKTPPLAPPLQGTRGGVPEITSFQRRLVITHDDHRTIHSALKLIHHVENDLALIYHKIYETCTFSNEIYANAVLATVCVFKSFDSKEKIQCSWRWPRPDAAALVLA